MNSIKCPNCGLVSFATASDCKRCRAKFLAPPEAAVMALPAGQISFNQTAAVPPLPVSFRTLPEYQPTATPIGGWLIVFAIGLGISLGLAVLSIETFVNLSSTQAFHDLTTPGSPIYISSFNFGITFEVIWSSLVAVTAVILLLRFFRKSRSFPRLAMALLGANIVFAFIDYLFGLNVQNELMEKLAPAIGKDKVAGMFPWYMGLIVWYSILSSIFWIGYFLSSRRVESTFIH